MVPYDHIEVFIADKKVGTLAKYQKYFYVFEYDARWLADGFSLNPFSLPLIKKVFIPKIDPFDGLFGVFADSLPDGWGRLLVDRMLLSKGEDLAKISPLQRLAIVGTSGMGALTYRPVYSMLSDHDIFDYDHYADECKKILASHPSDDLDMLFALGGSSGGARPKILTEIDGVDWLIKFPSSSDGTDIGLMEYDYMHCAGECGINVPEIKLFESKQCAGYFGCRRFDRNQDETGNVIRKHMVSVSGLLETSHRIPNLDYTQLMKLTLQLTQDYHEVEQMFRLMCFNVFAHNRDDHSCNFSFLYDDGRWQLSPAYDLTYSNSLGGEHATCIAGNGKDPGMADIMKVADYIDFPEYYAKEIVEEIREIVMGSLKKYLK